jgi:hypothetical protein
MLHALVERGVDGRGAAHEAVGFLEHGPAGGVADDTGTAALRFAVHDGPVRAFAAPDHEGHERGDACDQAQDASFQRTRTFILDGPNVPKARL